MNVEKSVFAVRLFELRLCLCPLCSDYSTRHPRQLEQNSNEIFHRFFPDFSFRSIFFIRI